MAKKAVKKSVISEDKKDKKVDSKKAAEAKAAQAKNKKGKDKASEKQTEGQKKTDDAKVAALNEEIGQLKEQLADAEENGKIWHEKYLRLSAEFDNYRKRTLKEKTDLTKSANAELLKDILSVVDDFERGIAHFDDVDDLKSMQEGVVLIYTKFVEFLKQNSVKEIEAKEKDFDIDYHEAMTKIPAPNDKLKGKVVDVLEKGYMLNDKVIRYAKVVIGE